MIATLPQDGNNEPSRACVAWGRIAGRGREALRGRAAAVWQGRLSVLGQLGHRRGVIFPPLDDFEAFVAASAEAGALKRGPRLYGMTGSLSYRRRE